ncbi:MAG: autotransporter-associated beta strand repeat-containing protein, partial [Akkermansiaceae bacterium]|nr:autotransporter-associated beta strand repeat-containing protein [Akkermansiaceae bacterium]
LGAFPTARGDYSTANITFDTTAGGGGFLAPAAASTTYMPAGTFTNASLTANGANFNVMSGKDITIGQALQDASGAAGALTKIGNGNLTLSGNNTYTGNTNVSGGTLRINGANSGNGAVNVDSGATLGGSGSVIGGINVSGVLAPGANSNSIESFRGGALSFGSTSTYAYQLQTLGLTGDLAHSTSELNIATGAILSLTDISTSTVRSNGEKLTLISYMGAGAWNGELFSDNSNTLANGSEITLGANKWMLKYDDIIAGSNFGSDTTGANRFVTMTVVPEPSVAVLLGGISTLLMLRRRRA